MKEHPILFSTEMVQAILAGRKTQTRRVIKPQPITPFQKNESMAGASITELHGANRTIKSRWAIYDRLWVKESLWQSAQDCARYYEDEIARLTPEKRAQAHWNDLRHIPSIFMRREMSRILLEVLNVRVQRVQEINRRDAVAEGIQYDSTMSPPEQPVKDFAFLWDSINAKREGCSWADNPWVWAVTFKRL